MRPGMVWGALLLGLSSGGWAQDDAAVDQKRVNEAIARAIQFLKPAELPAIEARPDLPTDELVLWTFLHAGVPADDARFQALWKKVVTRPLERTYEVSLLAMILEEVDRVRYQKRIGQCAQFLIDNQCKNGQWDYGAPTASVPPGDPAK